MVDGSDLAAGLDDGLGCALGVAAELEVEGGQGQLWVRGADELDTCIPRNAMDGVGAHDGPDRDGGAWVDALLGNPLLQARQRQRRVRAARKVDKAAFGEQARNGRLATGERGRGLAVAAACQLALVAASRRAART